MRPPSLHWFATYLTLSLIVASASLTMAQDTDHDGLSDAWERGVGRYEIVLGTFSWDQARLDAESRGGHLATIIHAQEWSDMQTVLGAALLGKNLWLGGTDAGTEGTFRWITGEKWTFTNWREGEPNNDSLGTGHGEAENYLIIWGHETGPFDGGKLFWNDVTATGGVLARDGYVLERGAWTDPTDPDTDDDGLADSEESLGLKNYEVVRFANRISWNDAKADAEARGGHLAVITSEAEWQKVVTTVGDVAQASPIWLGATDRDVEGLWRWVTGEPFVYTRWGSAQPDNRGDEDYLAVGVFGLPAGGWFDTALTGAVTGYLLERETLYPTDPNNPDTDGDGLRDGDEIRFFKTDPMKADTDGDGLTDFDEIRTWKTNPLVVDSDGDGLTDSQEALSTGTDPSKADTDGDGYNDKFEIDNGSDPNSGLSLPSVPVKAFTAIEIEFDTKSGVDYQIQSATALGVWSNVGPKIPGLGTPVSRLFSSRQFPARFWRVIIAK